MSLLDDLLASRKAATGHDWASLSPQERRQMLINEHVPVDPAFVESGRCRTTQKSIHATKDAALHEIRRAKLKGDITPYVCSECHGWHIGNTPRKRRKIKVRR